MNDFLETWLTTEPIKTVADDIRLNIGGDNDLFELTFRLYHLMDEDYKQEMRVYWNEPNYKEIDV